MQPNNFVNKTLILGIYFSEMIFLDFLQSVSSQNRLLYNTGSAREKEILLWLFTRNSS